MATKRGFLGCAAAAVTFFWVAAFGAGGAVVIGVSSFDDLVKIGTGPDWPLGGDYELTRDIDASASRAMNRGEGFKPIGGVKNPFTGAFYGNGFKVSGLYINRPDDGYVGMFGFLGEGAAVKNLSVVADTVIGGYAVGALAGGSDGLIRGCYSSGFVRAAVKEREGNVGGLVGVNGGRVAASFSGATVNGKAHVGGLVGFLTSEISESYAMGAVSGDNYVGGLVGYAFGGSINMCFSTGMVIGTGRQSVVGGLVGYDFGGSNAKWNNAGRVSSGANAGKLIKEAKITDCYWNINTSGIAVSAGGEGTTTAAMADGGLFGGWDFDSTWLKSDSSYYPLLKDIPVFTVIYKVEHNGKLVVDGVLDGVDLCAMALGDGAAGLEVRAVANPYFRFVRWSDGNTGAVRSDVALSDTMFTAEFEMLPGVETKTLAYTAGAHGKIRISGPNSTIESSGYSLNVVTGGYGVEVEAVADWGYRFWRWDDGRDDPKRIDAANGDMNYSALFIRAGDDPSASPEHGYTTSSGGRLRINDTYSPVHIDTVGSYIVAVPNPGYRFWKWNDNDSSIVRRDTTPETFTVAAGFREIKASGAISISSFDDLRKIGASPGFPLSADYQLTSDISVPGGANFEPIGSAGEPFTGTFCGNGRKIRGLRIERPDASFCGLFGYARNAVIRDVVLENAAVSGRDNTGALVGYCDNAFVDKCGSSGAVTGGANVGGLIGQVRGSVVNFCYSQASVSASSAGGGLAGAVSRGAIFQCYSSGKVTGPNTGGFAGACANCVNGREIFGCYWDVETSGRETSPGGALGLITDFMKLRTTYDGWDIGDPPGTGFTWAIRGAAGYPYLVFAGVVAYSPMPKPGVDSPPEPKLSVKIRGGTLSVRAPANYSAVQVRLIDMKGRTAARRAAAGKIEFSMRGIPAGRYIVETRVDGRRADVRQVLYSGY